ncbi:hypothetical protein B484DRAFT_397732 [Ochromonadaceae sp. CCMP2298]|nr:hypothetical protein B484DRAFT_397732 [Ochromonadaceae sp. CCMP2298]
MPRRYTPCTVNRGDGKKSSKQKTLGRLKKRVYKQEEQAALADVQKLAAVEAERLREPCHTDKDSPNNAAHVALGITSQPLYKHHLPLNRSEFIQPEVNAKRCSIPLWSVLEELLELTGFDVAHGIDPDSEGRYDMRGVKAFGFAARTDGAWAWLTKEGKGFLVQAFKPTDYHITRALSGHAVSSLACIASGWYGAADTTGNNFEFSGAVFKELARLQHDPYINSRTGKGFNIASALPQDMKSMQTYSGLGGCSATKPYFSIYDAWAADHAAALPLQMAWEAALDDITRIVEVRSAIQGTGNRLKNLVTYSNTLRRIAAAEGPQSLHKNLRAPLARAVLEAISIAKAAATVAEAAARAATDSAEQEAAYARSVLFTEAESAEASIETADAFKAALGPARAELTAVDALGVALEAVAAGLLRSMALATCESLGALMVAAITATATARAAPTHWAEDTRDRRLIGECTGDQLHQAIVDWYFANDVRPDNTGSLGARVIDIQLGVRFADAGSLHRWMARNMPGVEHPAAEDVEARRTVLRHVLHFARTLGFYTQKRTYTSPDFVERDGFLRVYEYMRDIELFVMCILHAEMRVGEKIINLLLDELRLREDIETAEKKERWARFQRGGAVAVPASTQVALPNADDSLTYMKRSHKITEWGAKNGRFKMEGTDQRKLFGNVEVLLLIVFPDSDGPNARCRREEYLQLCDNYSYLFMRLNDPVALNNSEINALQLEMDCWGRFFVDMFSRKDITNYIHNMIAGHFKFFLKRHGGSMYKLANIGMEGLVKWPVHTGASERQLAGRANKLNSILHRSRKKGEIRSGGSPGRSFVVDSFVERGEQLGEYAMICNPSMCNAYQGLCHFETGERAFKTCIIVNGPPGSNRIYLHAYKDLPYQREKFRHGGEALPLETAAAVGDIQ